MKKKIFLSAWIMLFSMNAFGQTDMTEVSQLDFEEDTTNVTSLNDIIQMQELVYTQSFRSNVVKGVWKRKKNFYVSYNNVKLSGKDLRTYNVNNGKYEDKQDVDFESDWAITLKRSRTIPFHKRPIADVVSFGLEFSGLDLSVAHYKQDTAAFYDSQIPLIIENKDGDKNEYYHMPWGLEMYTAAYGMHIGPSITLAPFTHLRSPGLANIRLMTYFNVGYRGALMLLVGDDEKDVNYANRNVSNYREDFDKMSNSSKISWAHGLTTSWGIRLNWKGIGIGYEMISGDLKFKSFEKKIYSGEKYKFSEKSKRITLSYIW